MPRGLPIGRLDAAPKQERGSSVEMWRASGGDVDPVAENIRVLNHDIALVNTDPVFDPFRPGSFRIALSHFVLHFGRAAQGVHDTDEFDEQAVSCRLDQPTVVLGNFRIDYLGAN